MDAPGAVAYPRAVMPLPLPILHSHSSAAGPRLPASLAWRPGPTWIFVGMLLGLLMLGVIVQNSEPPRPAGLPDDVAVDEARAMLADGLPIPTREFFLVTTLAGVAPPVSPDSLPLGRLAAARARLLEAARRHPGDPRLTTSLAHVDLAAGRLAVAERSYYSVLRSSPGYGEARLGLAVTLALRAEEEVAPIRVRARRLAAIGQVANVERGDPAYGAAVVDRLLLLRLVGREAEAQRVAAEALAAGLDEQWAERVRAFVRAAGATPPA